MTSSPLKKTAGNNSVPATRSEAEYKSTAIGFPHSAGAPSFYANNHPTTKSDSQKPSSILCYHSLLRKAHFFQFLRVWRRYLGSCYPHRWCI